MYSRIRTVVVFVVSVATGFAFLVMIAAVLIQVVGRTIGSSPVWTEELTRFALLYMTAFGVGLSLRSGDLVNVDIIYNLLPPRWSKFLAAVVCGITTVMCIGLVPPALKFFKIGAIQTSPALGLRMDYMHFAIVILLVLLAFFSVLRLIQILFDSESLLTSRDGD